MDVNDDIVDLGQGALLIGELDLVNLSALETFIENEQNAGNIGEIEIDTTK